MNHLRRGLQLALAAVIACAGGALILVLLLALGSVAVGVAAGAASGPAEVVIGGLIALAVALLAGGGAIAPALYAGWLPAFAAAAALTWLGRRRAWPRGRLAWAGGGAVAALACYVRIFPPERPRFPLLDMFAVPQAALPAAFMLAGAAAGQVYRSAMAATAPFFDFEEDPEEA
jgi:hypothetical protein